MNTGRLHCIHEPDSVQRKTVGPGDSTTPQATVPNLCSHLLQPSANPSLPTSHTYVYIDASSRIPKQVSPIPAPNTPASGKEGLSFKDYRTGITFLQEPQERVPMTVQSLIMESNMDSVQDDGICSSYWHQDTQAG